MPFVGGMGAYREICDGVIDDGYRGFRGCGILPFHRENVSLSANKS